MNKLVRSYLLQIFIWLYIFLLGTEGEQRQLRLRDLVNCVTDQDVGLCSDPLAQLRNATSCIFSSRKFVLCRGRPTACLELTDYTGTWLLSSSLLQCFLLTS